MSQVENHPPEVLSIRPARSEDAAAIRDLTREAYAKWVTVIGREPLPMRADYEVAVRSHRIDLLHAGGKLIALIEMIVETDHLLIENLAVSPAFQGRGFGRKLLAHAEHVAAALEKPCLKLYTNKLFAANVELYKSAGYEVEREEPIMDGHTVYMIKPMSS
jgi:ribosomal protein S18 acetylase RimI-like enzyme